MLPLKARNAAIVAAYLAQPDISQREIGRAFGLEKTQVYRILDDAGVRDPGRQSAIKRRHHREGRYDGASVGRKPAWPDCPPELRRDFDNIRKKGIRSAEARAMLDPGMQA